MKDLILATVLLLVGISTVASADEVLSISFYTDPVTGQRKVYDYTVAPVKGLIGGERRIEQPPKVTVNGIESADATALEAAIRAGKWPTVCPDGPAFKIEGVTAPRVVPSGCPNGRCPIR